MPAAVPEMPESVAQALRAQGVELEERDPALLRAYLQALLEANERFNLTAVTDPAQAWAMTSAPALYRPDLEVKDGNRRLMANPAFNAVPYAAQVQRLQKSAIEEGQRARTHVLVLGPSFWGLEPGDVGSWTSARNGYVAKQFRIDVVNDQQGQPTWSYALARQLVALARAAHAGRAPAGVYHGTASGATTWYELARAVFTGAGLDPERIRPTDSQHFPSPTRRPAYSVLAHGRWAAAGLSPLADWREMLTEALPRLLPAPAPAATEHTE